LPSNPRRPQERLDIPGFLGILEDAEPEMGMMYGEPVGIMDSCTNFAPTGSGPLKDSIYAAPKISRLAVRGGSQSKLALTDTVPNAGGSLVDFAEDGSGVEYGNAAQAACRGDV
jgi:hypothetical protein